MATLNRWLGALVGAALSPFQSLPPLVGLTVVSLVVAIGMLLVFRAVSNQPDLKAVKRRIQAAFFEVRLFNDDVRALDGLLDVLRHNLTYLRLSLAPLLWMALPLVLLVAHLQFYYGYDGLMPGQSTIVKVRLKDAAVPANGAPVIGLEAPPGLMVQTPAVWIPSEREAAWRIGVDRQGDFELRVTVGGTVVTKQVRASNRVGWRVPGRFESGVLNQLLFPGEPPIDPDIPIESIVVTYPERAIGVLGYSVNWLVAFFALSLLLAWLMRSRFGVVM
ncbi:MAG: hypothetical protein WD690_07290 [Vicinamibacterales bacterium]